MEHGKAIGGYLAANETRDIQLAFGGAPFWADWLWAGYRSTNATLDLAMVGSNGTVREWTWSPGDLRLEVGRFPHEDVYSLRLHNPTDATLRYDLAYDQTCDCRLKPIPYDGGYAWTNIPLEAGQTAHFSVEAQPLFAGEGDATVAPTLTATLFRAEDADPTYPDGVEVLAEWTTDDRWWNASVTADEPGTYYVLLRADSGAVEAGPWRFLLFPTVEVEDAPMSRLPFVFAGLAVAVDAAYGLGRLKRR